MIGTTDTSEVAAATVEPQAATTTPVTENKPYRVITLENVRQLRQCAQFFRIFEWLLDDQEKYILQDNKVLIKLDQEKIDESRAMIKKVKTNLEAIMSLHPQYIHDFYFICEKLSDENGLQLYTQGPIPDSVFKDSVVDSLKATGVNKQDWLAVAIHVTSQMNMAIG